MPTMIEATHEPDTFHRSIGCKPRYTRNDFHRRDQDALDRALEMTLDDDRDQGRVDQVRQMLAEDGWFTAASFAACLQQCATLNLGSADTPPCHANDEIKHAYERDPNANKLRKRMLSHNVSIYDPTPIASIQAAQSKKPKRRK
jgi:hypothetical protein